MDDSEQPKSGQMDQQSALRPKPTLLKSGHNDSFHGHSGRAMGGTASQRYETVAKFALP